eukprot:scaffold2987_cov170-Amphora_coffeaeformis.AAC.11
MSSARTASTKPWRAIGSGWREEAVEECFAVVVVWKLLLVVEEDEGDDLARRPSATEVEKLRVCGGDGVVEEMWTVSPPPCDSDGPAAMAAMASTSTRNFSLANPETTIKVEHVGGKCPIMSSRACI